MEGDPCSVGRCPRLCVGYGELCPEHQAEFVNSPEFKAYEKATGRKAHLRAWELFLDFCARVSKRDFDVRG